MSKRSMARPIWQPWIVWLGAGLALSLLVVWIGVGLLPALAQMHKIPTLVGITGDVTTLLLHSQTVVLSPNSSTALSVQVRDANGQRVPGLPVNFSANIGVVAPATVTTNENGIAEATYNANSSYGPVVITAEVNGVTDTTYLEIRNALQAEVPTHTVLLAANVNQRKPGEQATFTVTVLDAAGQPVQGETVTFFGSLGEVNPASGITDAAGKLTSIFTAGNDNGQAKLVALSGYGSGSTQIQVLGAPVATPIPTNYRIYLPSVAR